MAEAALLTEASVTAVDHISDDFVRVSLHSPALRTARWTAGTKVQLRLPGDGWTMRTYTPLHWDVADGRTELLAYRHGHGPASTWCGEVAAGDSIRFMGPRRSIDAPSAGERILFVGDESSVALACSLATTGAEVTHLFEATRPAELPQTLAKLSLPAEVCGNDTLLERLRVLAATVATPYRLIVTGNAATVHAVRREIRNWPAPPAKVVGKAYWAAGRAGLD
jgi:ferric-chelate reductase (NADPH)